ncbi:hypothetical protein H7Y21_01955 [Arenimonas sp.]|nr:hypothetical protein [Candidatus Parcubacteria bacterium]
MKNTEILRETVMDYFPSEKIISETERRVSISSSTIIGSSVSIGLMPISIIETDKKIYFGGLFGTSVVDKSTWSKDESNSEKNIWVSKPTKGFELGLQYFIPEERVTPAFRFIYKIYQAFSRINFKSKITITYKK